MLTIHKQLKYRKNANSIVAKMLTVIVFGQ